MANPRIDSYRKRLNSLFAQISAVNDLQLKSHWSRYLCILVSGFIEVGVYEILVQYSQDKAATAVTSYVLSRLDGFRNPKTQQIINVLNNFDKAWGERFAAETSDAQRKAIDSIVDRRNKIAHGDDDGISYVIIKEYYDRAVEVIALIDQIVNPPGA